MNLVHQKCIACEAGTDPLTDAEANRLLGDLAGWRIERGALKREYTFANFRASIDFVNRVANIAETEGHHPDIFIWYKVVTLILTTHAIGGLSVNDFIVAAKIDAEQ